MRLRYSSLFEFTDDTGDKANCNGTLIENIVGSSYSIE